MSNEENYGKGLIYEIPENLKYEERIFWIFNLKQIIIFSAFVLVSVLIFTKTPLPATIRIVLSGFVISVGFIFASIKQLQEEVEKRISFCLSRKRMHWTDSSTIDYFVKIKRIEGEVVVTKNNDLLTILLVKPIDFNVLSDDSKIALLNGYKAFLNSITFPIQILTRTTKIDLTAYFNSAKLKAAKNNDLKVVNDLEIFEDFILDYLNSKKIHDRLFYIVILQNKEKNYEQDKTELYLKVQNCKDKLLMAGIQSKVLNETSLISLYSSFFGNYIETDSDYQSIVCMSNSFFKKQEQVL